MFKTWFSHRCGEELSESQWEQKKSNVGRLPPDYRVSHCQLLTPLHCLMLVWVSLLVQLKHSTFDFCGWDLMRTLQRSLTLIFCVYIISYTAYPFAVSTHISNPAEHVLRSLSRIHIYAWNKPRNNEYIFMKFDIGEFLEKNCPTILILMKIRQFL